MAIRPRVSRAELSRAITRIVNRRVKIDDPNREKLPDSPDADPREVLDYLLRYSGPEIPSDVKQADVADMLKLNNWLWWETQRRELQILKIGRTRGLFLSQLGAQLGVKKQGILDRIDRMEALLRHDRPDEQISRDERRRKRQARQRHDAEEAWLEAHQDQLLTLIERMVSHANRYGVDGDDPELGRWVDELAADARDHALTSTTMVILGLAVDELRSAPGSWPSTAPARMPCTATWRAPSCCAAGSQS